MLSHRSPAHRQRGVVLFLTLIVLVAMLLSGVALFRTVDTGVLVAGNVALQKGATRQGDQGTEAAIAWLGSRAPEDLYVNGSGYVANGLMDVPGSNQSWAQWWANYAASNTPVSLPTDANTGNTVSYFIQRLCTAAGAPYTAGVECIGPPQGGGRGSSKGVGFVALNRASSVYYRITSRIVGPRNTVSYIQTVVSL